jgi:glycopeptide antibiotics resistance protein
MQLSWQEYLDQTRLRVKTIILWSVYLIYILILTLKPFEFSSGYFYQFFKFQHGFFHAIFSSFQPADILLNILFFIPLGFLTGLLLRINQKDPPTIIKTSTIICLVASVIAEFLQLFLIRTTSLTDIITNTLGGYLGARLVSQVSLTAVGLVPQFIVNRGTKIIKFTELIYAALLLILFSLPFWLNGFYNWDENFHLCLGNEATGDRPWEGAIYELVIYDRMLSQEEALQCYYSRRSESLKSHILAHYRFDEGHGRYIYNRASAIDSLKLEISDTSKVCWLNPSNGLVLRQGGVIKSTVPASQLCAALQAANQLSLEVRFRPANLIQTGPGRIVTFSASTEKRNFTLGQAAGQLNFRVRTPLTGPNGSRVDLYTENPVLTHRPQHVVAVFNRGAEIIFLNGHELEDSVRGLSNYMSSLSGFGRGTFGKVSLCFLMLFPLGWLSQVTVGGNHKKYVRGFFINLLPVFFAECIFFCFYQQPFDLPILGIATFTAGLTFVLSLFPYFREMD